MRVKRDADGNIYIEEPKMPAGASMECVIRCEDYPHWNYRTEEGREQFGHVAAMKHWEMPWLCHFLFKHGDHVVGEMYIQSELEERQ